MESGTAIRGYAHFLILLSLLTVEFLLYVPGHDDRRGDVQDPRTLDTAYRLVFRGQSRYERCIDLFHRTFRMGRMIQSFVACGSGVGYATRCRATMRGHDAAFC